MIINTHEKFLKKHGHNFHEKLSENGYIGNKDVVFRHFLEAVIETDAFIRSGQSTKDPALQITEEEYFKLLICNMNAMLLSEHNYEENINTELDDAEKENIFNQIKEKYKSIEYQKKEPDARLEDKNEKEPQTKIWLKDERTGIVCGINKQGELFLGNNESGSNLPDTLGNREKIIDYFCSATDRHSEYGQLLQKCIEGSLNWEILKSQIDNLKTRKEELETEKENEEEWDLEM